MDGWNIKYIFMQNRGVNYQFKPHFCYYHILKRAQRSVDRSVYRVPLGSMCEILRLSWSFPASWEMLCSILLFILLQQQINRKLSWTDGRNASTSWNCWLKQSHVDTGMTGMWEQWSLVCFKIWDISSLWQNRCQTVNQLQKDSPTAPFWLPCPWVSVTFWNRQRSVRTHFTCDCAAVHRWGRSQAFF